MALDLLLNLAWSRLQKNSTESSGINDTLRRLNALVEGLSECEKRQCDRTVGFGGSPDENGLAKS